MKFRAIDKLGWAKTDESGNPGLSVYEHCRHVGWVAWAIIENGSLIPNNRINSLAAAIIASIHDVGKWSPDFLHMCPKWLEQEGYQLQAEREAWTLHQRHEEISQCTIQLFLLLREVASSEAIAWSMVAGAHHGKLYPSKNLGNTDLSRFVTEWDKDRHAIILALEEEFTAIPSVGLHKRDALTIWLMGLTSVADWIGSDQTYFPIHEGFNSEKSREAALKAVESIGLCKPEIVRNLSFKEIFGFSANELQLNAIASISEPGIYVIEAPMGLGKTEAALACAYNLLSNEQASGIYFALPTQLTSNRIHQRVSEFLGVICPSSPNVRLAHSSAWLEDDYYQPRPVRTLLKEKNGDATTSRDWFASAKRALLANFGVGTIDQALMAVVAVKHFFVRRFALAGKVIIIDEVHSYDHFTGTLIGCLCKELLKLNCTVIILSATLLPQVRNRLLDVNYKEIGHLDYPLITGKTTSNRVIQPLNSKPRSRPKVDRYFKSNQSLVVDAVAAARHGARVLWVCNTVNSTQAVYQKLAMYTDIEIGLLHSRFPYYQRQELEERWMERMGKKGPTSGGCILVSTQIVEQSVDIDADILITELAPSDMLLQRLGRLWRHLEDRPPSLRPVRAPEMWILNEEKSLAELKALSSNDLKKALGVKQKVYAAYVLLKSYETFLTYPQINLADDNGNCDIRKILWLTYNNDENDPESWLELASELKGTEYAERELAKGNTNLFAKLALEDEEGKQTRLIEIETLSLLIAVDISDGSIILLNGSVVELPIKEFDINQVRAVHRNLIRVHKWPFEKPSSESPVSFYLKNEHRIAVLCPTTGRLTVDGMKEEIILTWSDDLGVKLTNIKGEVDESCD